MSAALDRRPEDEGGAQSGAEPRPGLAATGDPDGEAAFPRSHLFRFIQRHPVGTAAALAATIWVGPRRLGRMGLSGLRAASREINAIAPLLQIAIRANRR